MKLVKKHTAGMKQYKEFKKGIGMIGKIEAVSYTHLDVYKRQGLNQETLIRVE